MHVKAIVPGTEGITHPDSALTPGDHKQLHLCASGGLQAIKMESEPSCSRVRGPPPRTQLKITAQGENTAVYLIHLTFPWIPNPLPTLCCPYRKGHFKMEFKMVH